MTLLDCLKRAVESDSPATVQQIMESDIYFGTYDGDEIEIEEVMIGSTGQMQVLFSGGYS